MRNITISKIVVTGGPCAGKTTAMSWIQNEFTKKGYSVLFIPETATELITGGVAPWTCESNYDFQRILIKLQKEKEKIFREAAYSMQSEKVLIVCDRGILDNKAYMTTEEFSYLFLDEVVERDNYDAVFHLVTAAKGAEEFYTTANNAARTESVSQARQIDDKIISAWTGHPHLRIIDNSFNFEDKMKKLISEISSFLGEPEPYEIERKFLIEFPNIDWLENYPHCNKVDIIQTYLLSPFGEETRIRQRGTNGSYIYTKTTKHTISGLKRVEIEKRLSEKEYLTLLMDADPTKKQIRKTRYCLVYASQYFEIDIFPFWKDKAIAEIELNNSSTEIVFPEQLKIIKEVTFDDSFKNISLASK